nr:unnamed protein product [Digitaria exilis]
MDDAASPRPSGHNISTETTRLDMWPVSGEQSSLVLHLAVTETHKWLGIGGRSARLRRSRRLGRTARMQLSAGLQTAGDELRRLMVRATTQELRMTEVFRGLPSVDWEDAVPWGVEARVAELAAAALPAGCLAFSCEASFSVRVEIVYDEADELLRACVAVGAGIGESTGGDAPPSCAICFEEMAAATRRHHAPSASRRWRRRRVPSASRRWRRAQRRRRRRRRRGCRGARTASMAGA